MEQQANSFDKASLIKIGKGILIAGGGAALVYFLQAVPEMDFGVYTPIATAIAAVLINAIKEYKEGN